jgi:hypothetical protein
MLTEDLYIREEPKMFLDEAWLAKRVYRFEMVSGVAVRAEATSSIENCLFCLDGYTED